MANPIPIRLSDEKWAYYSEQAQAEGIGLSTYLKRRLEHGDRVAEQLAELRRMLAEALADRDRDRPAERSQAGSAVADSAVSIEMLLLLRSVVPQDKLGVAHGELRRQGLAVWTGEKGGRK
jgi:hypothetical protein